MSIIKYGLRHKKSGKMLGFREESNEGADFCDDITVVLTNNNERLWLVDTPMNAEYVRNHSTEWYNAGYSTPHHSYEPEELEVAKIITDIEKIDVVIPTMKEYLSLMYKESNRAHYNHCIKQLETHKMFYSLYELKELVGSKKWPV